MDRRAVIQKIESELLRCRNELRGLRSGGSIFQCDFREFGVNPWMLGIGGLDVARYGWIRDTFPDSSLNDRLNANNTSSIIHTLFGVDPGPHASSFEVNDKLIQERNLESTDKWGYSINLTTWQLGTVTYYEDGENTVTLSEEGNNFDDKSADDDDENAVVVISINHTVGSLLIQLCKDFLPNIQDKGTFIEHLERNSSNHPDVRRY